MTTEKQITDLLVRGQYKYKDIAKRDIQSALSYFKELNLVMDRYVYPNGQPRDLVTLNGTIPVNYKGQRYNIPVQIFLSDTHPYTPPLCYVRPTPEMSINVSDHVDANGRINLPCIREWAYPQSDIYVLLNLMTMKFSEQPPVFAKRQGQVQPRNPTNQAQQQPTSEWGSYPNSSSRPPYPAYPQNPVGQSNILPYPANNSGYQMPSYPSSSSSNTPYPSNPNPYYPMPQPSQPVSYLKSDSGSNIGNVRPFSGETSSTFSPYPSYSGDTIKPEHLMMSLISAVQDKAQKRNYEITSLKQAEIDSLNRVNQDLEEGQSNLASFCNEAENEILNLNNLTIELKEKTASLNESINQMQHRDKASIEDVVVTPAPLYRQLMQLFAEELAIQDLIFYLGEGLQNRTVNLADFLKQVRFLTRKQFMLRATMQQARQRAALPL